MDPSCGRPLPPSPPEEGFLHEGTGGRALQDASLPPYLSLLINFIRLKVPVS